MVEITIIYTTNLNSVSDIFLSFDLPTESHVIVQHAPLLRYDLSDRDLLTMSRTIGGFSNGCPLFAC